MITHKKSIDLLRQGLRMNVILHKSFCGRNRFVTYQSRFCPCLEPIWGQRGENAHSGLCNLSVHA